MAAPHSPTPSPSAVPHDLIAKITALPRERIAEVEDFVDFLGLREQERKLAHAATAASETAFAKVWDNSEDAAYDAL